MMVLEGVLLTTGLIKALYSKESISRHFFSTFCLKRQMLVVGFAKHHFIEQPLSWLIESM